MEVIMLIRAALCVAIVACSAGLTRAQDGARRLAAEDLAGGVVFRSIGPANMGGRVAAVRFAPGDSKTFYAGFGTGGLWKTTNRGVTLAPVMDDAATTSIGAVAVADAGPDWAGWKDEKPDPDGDAKREALRTKDPEAFAKAEAEKGKGKIVWVGTGEGNNRNSSSWGNGVYRSTDGGGTFKPVGLEDSHNIPAIAVDPRNPDVCYVAALGHLWGPNETRGVYKTDDGGRTWRKVLEGDASTGACDVIVDPSNPDTVYAALYTRTRTAFSYTSGSEVGGIFRSDDAGNSWKKLGNGLPKRTARIGLDVFRKNTRVVYAVVESDEGGAGVDPFDNRSREGGVFRSEDRGETWTRLWPFTPRAFYFSRIRVDPRDDARVYLLGWVLYVSDDGGRSFRAGGARKPHVDLHAFDIDLDDPDHLLLGTDGGVYQSFDRGATWEFLDHIAVGQFYNVAVDNGRPYRVAGGLQDNGTWVGPSASRTNATTWSGEPAPPITNADWTFVVGGDGFHVAFDPEKPEIMYAESQGGYLSRIDTRTRLTKLLRPSPKEGQLRHRFNWNSPFFVSPHDPSVVYLGGNCVYRLTQRGEHWERISEDLSTRQIEKLDRVGSEAETHCTVVSLAESPLAKGTLWAGTDDGLIHVTTDGGRTWSNVTPPEVNGWYVSRLEPSHHDAAACYASIDGHRSDHYDPLVLMTTDLGRTWATITGDLPPGASVKVVREDLGSANVLYAGTERGFYASLDRGASWLRLNARSLPSVPVDDIVQHPRTRDLVLGTHGRSIYIVDDASFFAQLTPEVVASELHLFDVPEAEPFYLMPHGGVWTDDEFAAGNPPAGASITFWVSRPDPTQAASISITNEAGAAVRNIPVEQKAGINRVVWDLQPENFDRVPDPAFAGHPVFVPAGTYTVTLTRGQFKMSKKVVVLPAPDRDAAP